MKTRVLSALLFICGNFVSAQNKSDIDKILKTYDTQKISNLVKEVNERDVFKQNKINVFLLFNASFEREYTKDGRLYEMIDVIDNKPIYRTTDNLLSAVAIRTRYLQPGAVPGSLGLNLQGEGLNIGVWDERTALTTHVEFADDNGGTRIITPEGATTSVSYHATHVSGTVGAKGVSSSARGMAMKATIKSYNWSADENEVISEASNNAMLVSNHSYGIPIYNDSGSFNVPGAWYMGCYSDDSVAWDQISYQHPYYLMVASAGNDGTTSYSGGLGGGLDKLTGNKNSKNNLVVANANPSVHPVTGVMNSLSINPGSSQGPSDDGRIKPDIAADGTNLNSTSDESNTAYGTSSGTSMASPSVAGSLLLLQEHYHNLNDEFMLAATIKGLVCHTALDDPSTAGPDPRFGWGLMDSRKAANIITDSATDTPTTNISELNLNQGEILTFNVIVSDPKKLEATICWTDVPGTAKNGQLNSTSPALVNDLDLRIIKGDEVNYPWKLQLSDLSALAVKGDNIVDNVEKVEVDDAAGTYTIQVFHKGTLTGGTQNFSIIISGFDQMILSNDDFLKKNIFLYPNPVNDLLNIDSNIHHFLKYEIYDVQGRIIKSELISNQNNFSINTSSLTKGLYVLNLISENGNFVEKIIKK